MKNSIFTSKCSSDPFDRYVTLDTWLTALAELGVNPGEFDAEYEARKRMRIIEAATKKYTENATTSLAGPARAIARDPQRVDHVLDVANMGAASVTPEHRARVLELLSRAAEEAQRSMSQKFWARGESIIGILKPTFDEFTARITTARAKIPDGVQDLDDATRLGHGDDWMQLEQDIAAWRTVTELLTAWITNSIIGKEGDRGVDWMVGDPDSFKSTRAGRNTIPALADAITAGGPNLAPPTEEQRAQVQRDRLNPPTDSEARAAAHHANQADKEARSALPFATRIR